MMRGVVGKTASAYEYLKTMAISGALRPARRLAPTQLLEIFPFHVSSGPVRDALARLAAEGFIRHDQSRSRGYFTKDWTVKEQHELHCLGYIYLSANMRCMVESPLDLFEDLAAIEPDIVEGEAGPAKVVDYLEGLHMGLAHAGRNETIIELNQTVVDRTHLIRIIDLNVPGAARPVAAALRTFGRAMLDQNLDAAQAAGQAVLDARLARLPHLVAEANARARQSRIP